MDYFLAFVDEIGRGVNGGYLYRLDFTISPEVVWGEYFNTTPSGIIPDLQPDKNTISLSGKIEFPRRMELAKRNYCFSMQDCFDGILPLFFCEIDDDVIEYNDAPFFLNFGEHKEKVEEMLKSIGVEMFDVEENQIGDESVYDKFINSTEDFTDDEYDDEDDDDPDIF